MKTTVLTISLSLAFFSNGIAQSYYPSVKFTPSPTTFKHYDPSGLVNSVSTTDAAPIQPTRVARQPVYQEPVRETDPVVESRVSAYYEDGYGDNITWKRISLKVAITTNSMGFDEIKVTAYMNEIGSWSTVSYGSVSKTYGAIAKEFTYQASVSGKIVYFNI